ncbi:MAG TPA: hypothetical protein VGQ26_29515 [Streptosporangiaceae bacterium]|jgi:hypothetical protein|nr:hypothetical protein [Streptosporangiaceae bacterium]
MPIQLSSTGTTADVPVAPDARVRYVPLPPARPFVEYRVAAIEPSRREEDR